MSKQKQAQLRKDVMPYASPKSKKSTIQLLNTLPPFFILWFLAYQSLTVSVWLSLAISVVAALFMVRAFIIFHDCAHQSFYQNKKINRIIGTATGVLTHFAFEKWKREHAIHHATSGNLDQRGTGDIWIMTVKEYQRASKWQKFQYRLYRNPFVMFGLGPFMLFLYSNRFNRKDARKKERLNTYLINGLLLLIYLVMFWTLGWQAVLFVQLPIVYVAGVLGVWLFYVQHQFEDSYFEHESEWDYVKAAVDGSSYYKLPKWLEWFTGNIGYHHVHHLAPRVPNYLLNRAHEETPPLQKATTITLKTSLESLRFRLFDEDKKLFVSFKDISLSSKNTNTVRS
ncbi:fatty acid desaturase [Gracilibacillus caseinilyticus]|uniref:Fatty acid desaturase n=1 Tax=Gracilibacillus caseinilyticus TaxID=2932256 RepID=A0ABY4EY70_9BACI|nr:fatty acid desaturase [Gracilibacillus caseinilyticus]UOQ49230.1 fatty acid desaturase [Gracilibacillus caseinilyticus]